MRKLLKSSLSILIFITGSICCLSCNKTDHPYGIYAPNGLDVPSPTPTPIIGTFYVLVQDLDSKTIYPNVTVQAIPPDNSVTYSGNSGISGIASFTPPEIETGTWTIRIPVQNSLPFTTSTMSSIITAANQTVTFASGMATVALTPTALTQYSSTNGGVFTYNLVYNQPNPLHVPVTIRFPKLPLNWSAYVSPTTIGYVGNDQASVTISTAGCVDQAPSFAVTTIDSVGNTRAASAPTTITHSFPTTFLVTWTTNSTGQIDTNIGDGCSPPSSKPTFMQWPCSGYCEPVWFTTVNVTYTSGCSQPTTINLIRHEDNGGTACCGEGAWWNAANGVGSNNCGTWSAAVTSSGNGSWPLTVTNTVSNNPTLTFAISNPDFSQGITYRGNVPGSGTVTLVNQSNWSQ